MSMNTWIGVEEARNAVLNGTGAGVKVAILDSGVELSHTALTGLELVDDIAVIQDGPMLVTAPGNGVDLFGHGTAIASIIRAMAPRILLGSIRVMGAHLNSRTEIIREGVRIALERGYQILNCSFGCRGDAKYVMDYKLWIDEAYLKRVHIVSACNNLDFTVREWPGHFPTVVTVNMARVEHQEALYHRTGNLVEFAARGANIDVPWTNQRRKLVTGSSYAVPHVVALLARLLSIYPDLSPLAAKELLRQLADPLPADLAGANVPM
jgi:subtilisin family serine protease